MSVFAVLGRRKQEDQQFKITLSYRMRLSSAQNKDPDSFNLAELSSVMLPDSQLSRMYWLGLGTPQSLTIL